MNVLKSKQTISNKHFVTESFIKNHRVESVIKGTLYARS